MTAIPHGFRLKPVEAVQAWLDAAEITSGSLFRRIGAQGRVVDCPLTPQVVALLVKRRALLAGPDPARLSGYSSRPGFMTSAARHGASVWKLAASVAPPFNGYASSATPARRSCGEPNAPHRSG